MKSSHLIYPKFKYLFQHWLVLATLVINLLIIFAFVVLLYLHAFNVLTHNQTTQHIVSCNIQQQHLFQLQNIINLQQQYFELIVLSNLTDFSVLQPILPPNTEIQVITDALQGSLKIGQSLADSPASSVHGKLQQSQIIQCMVMENSYLFLTTRFTFIQKSLEKYYLWMVDSSFEVVFSTLHTINSNLSESMYSTLALKNEDQVTYSQIVNILQQMKVLKNQPYEIQSFSLLSKSNSNIQFQLATLKFRNTALQNSARIATVSFVNTLFYGIMLGKNADIQNWISNWEEINHHIIRFVYYDSLILFIIVCVIVVTISRHFLKTLTFLKAYHLMLIKTIEASEFLETSQYSDMHFTWAEQRSLAIEYKQLLTNLREFMWLVFNYPSLIEDEPFFSQQVDISMLQHGLKLFQGKRDLDPYYFIAESLIQHLQYKKQMDSAMQANRELCQKMTQQLKGLRKMYEMEDESDSEFLKEQISALVCRLYENYLGLLKLYCKQGKKSEAQKTLEHLDQEVEKTYHIRPELLLEAEIIRVRISDDMRVIEDTKKFYNKVVQKKQFNRPYQQIWQIFRLKQLIELQIFCKYSQIESPQNLSKQLMQIFGDNSQSLIPIHVNRKFYDPVIRCDLIKKFQQINQKDKELLSQIMKFYTRDKKVVIMVDCSEPLKQHTLIQSIFFTMGKVLSSTDGVYIYLYSDNYIKLKGGAKKHLQKLKTKSLIDQIQAQRGLRNKQKKLVKCFTGIFKEQEQEMPDHGCYFILYTHELYPYANEHFNQISRLQKDRYLDLCTSIKNSYCHLLVISSLRQNKEKKSKSYSPKRLGFEAHDYRFMNGEDSNQVEQQLFDFLK